MVTTMLTLILIGLVIAIYRWTYYLATNERHSQSDKNDYGVGALGVVILVIFLIITVTYRTRQTTIEMVSSGEITITEKDTKEYTWEYKK